MGLTESIFTKGNNIQLLPAAAVLFVACCFFASGCLQANMQVIMAATQKAIVFFISWVRMTFC
jgi:hypothetical protein